MATSRQQTPMKRARADWQKEARERHILDSAAALFAYHGRLPAMAEVAARAGLAKGTLYLYFRGREALWLELLNNCLGRWVDAIEARVAQGAPVPVAVVEGARVDPMLIPLCTYNATLIEPNAGPDEAERFKEASAGHIFRLGDFIAPRLGLAEADARRRVLLTYAMLLGLWQMSTPTAPIDGEERRSGFWHRDWDAEALVGLAALWSAPAHR